MIDTHCHLNFKAFNQDLVEVVRRYKEKGGESLVIVGAKIDSSQKAIEISKKFPFCFASVGFHPHHITEINNLNDIESSLEELIKNPKVVAIGETGIDYHHYKNYPTIDQINKLKQKELFELHLKIANRHKLPLIIHCRQAQEDLLNYMTNFMRQVCLTGVFHCFDGNKDYLNEVLSLGFYVGFDGNITYKANSHLRELVKVTPLERLLVETDSPYLTPIPFRGERNEPSYLKYTIECIAQIKEKTVKEIEDITSNNARSLFNIASQ